MDLGQVEDEDEIDGEDNANEGGFTAGRAGGGGVGGGPGKEWLEEYGQRLCCDDV